MLFFNRNPHDYSCLLFSLFLPSFTSSPPWPTQTCILTTSQCWNIKTTPKCVIPKPHYIRKEVLLTHLKGKCLLHFLWKILLLHSHVWCHLMSRVEGWAKRLIEPPPGGTTQSTTSTLTHSSDQGCPSLGWQKKGTVGGCKGWGLQKAYIHQLREVSGWK